MELSEDNYHNYLLDKIFLLSLTFVIQVAKMTLIGDALVDLWAILIEKKHKAIDEGVPMTTCSLAKGHAS